MATNPADSSNSAGYTDLGNLYQTPQRRNPIGMNIPGGFPEHAEEDDAVVDAPPNAEEMELIKQHRQQMKAQAMGKGVDRKLAKRAFKFTTPSSTINIPTLKGASNWDRWYQTVYRCCQIAGIDPILTGDMAEPVDDNEWLEWNTANAWIEGNIRMSLESGGLSHIAGVKGAYNMVGALEGAYKMKGYSTREVFWRTITRASLADYKGVTEYVEAMKKARTKLGELGHHYTWEITTCFLHGLPPTYETFVDMVLNSRGKDAYGKLLELDFDTIVEQLLDRERRQKLIKTPVPDSDKALIAGNKSSNNNGGSKGNGRNNRNGRGSSRYPKCDDCGASHGPICFLASPDKAPPVWVEKNKDRIEDFKKKKKNGGKDSEKLQKAACARAIAVTKNRDDGWYFDNAASFHMTYSEAYFVGEPTPLENPVPLETAEGNILEATAVGTAMLETVIKDENGEDQECILTLENVHFVDGLSTNLLSLGTFQRNGLTYTGKGDGLRV